MDIMELGAIGELVGGVAVIGTLGDLAAQVRHGPLVVSAKDSKVSFRRIPARGERQPEPASKSSARSVPKMR